MYPGWCSPLYVPGWVTAGCTSGVSLLGVPQGVLLEECGCPKGVLWENVGCPEVLFLPVSALFRVFFMLISAHLGPGFGRF